MSKKTYITPAMQVYHQQPSQLLSGSYAVRALDEDSLFDWCSNGLDGDDR